MLAAHDTAGSHRSAAKANPTLNDHATVAWDGSSQQVASVRQCESLCIASDPIRSAKYAARSDD